MKHFHQYLTGLLLIGMLAAACEEREKPLNLPPSVRLDEAVDVTRTGAVLHGEVTPNGEGLVSRIRFRYGETEEMERLVACAPEERQVSASLTGLRAGVRHYYCLEAGNEYDMVRSEVRSFVTRPNIPPVISGVSLLNQGPVSITLEYHILDNGGEEITATGFCYWKEGNHSEELAADVQKGEDGSFRARIGGLEMETDYCIQACAANAVGETRSEVYRFRTGEAVILTEAGTLGEAIGQEEKYRFSTLNIAGPLNGTDIRCLREMMGTDIDGATTPGQLHTLNLNDASIVAGGQSYDGSRYTEADILSRGMFSGCLSLRHLTLPATTAVVEANAFENCSALDTLCLSPLIRQFAPSAGCSGLSAIIVPAESLTLSCAAGVLYDKEGTSLLWFPESKDGTEFRVPSAVESVGDYAFRNAGLAQVVLPASLAAIGREAFAGSQITSMDIPDNVEILPYGCFQGCSRLDRISLGAGTGYLSEYCFEGCGALRHLYVRNADFPPSCREETFGGAEFLFGQCTLHIPAGSKSVYRNHKVWGQFKNMVEE